MLSHDNVNVEFKKIMYSYNGVLKSDYLKSKLFEDQISNGLVIKGSGYTVGA